MKEKAVESFYYTGSSMNITFSEGDFLLVEPYKTAKDIEVGDVIVFRPLDISDNKNIVHRIIEITENGKIRTQGDSNSEPDRQELSFEDIKGKVTNAARPERIEKHIVYNQHSKASRELAQEIMEKNEREHNNLKITMDESMENLENGETHQKYINSKEYEDFMQAIGDYEAEKITEEEFRNSRKTLENSEVYQNYFKSDEYKNYETSMRNLRSFDPVRIHTDSREVREKFQNLSAFPTALMDIPEYVTEKGKNNKEVKALRKIQSVQELEAWEADQINAIKAIISMEKVEISKEKGKGGKP